MKKRPTPRRMFPVLLLLLTVSAPPLEARDGGALPRIAEIDGDPVLTLLSPDDIPSIDQPEFVSAAAADFMKKNEMVIGVVANGVAKAYSLWHLDRHEIVNDVFTDEPLAVTW